MREIAKESIFQLLPRNARFYLTANIKTLKKYWSQKYTQVSTLKSALLLFRFDISSALIRSFAMGSFTSFRGGPWKNLTTTNVYPQHKYRSIAVETQIRPGSYFVSGQDPVA